MPFLQVFNEIRLFVCQIQITSSCCCLFLISQLIDLIISLIKDNNLYYFQYFAKKKPLLFLFKKPTFPLNYPHSVSWRRQTTAHRTLSSIPAFGRQTVTADSSFIARVAVAVGLLLSLTTIPYCFVCSSTLYTSRFRLLLLLLSRVISTQIQ